MDLIKELKQNEKAFGLMSEEMQAKALSIGRGTGAFQHIPYGSNKLEWIETRGSPTFCYGCTYQLLPDYTEEPEMLECEVINDAGYLWFEIESESEKAALSCAPNYPDFIGFKYEDGRVMVEVRRYKGKHNQCFTDSVITERLDSYEVLTPTHVLFRSKP